MPAQQVLRIFFAAFYPSNIIVVDKNRLFLSTTAHLLDKKLYNCHCKRQLYKEQK